MSAESALLRRAAETLRRAAEAAHVGVDGGFVPWQVSRADATQVWDDRERLVASAEGIAEAHYIAAVDPVVGANLANLLDAIDRAARLSGAAAEHPEALSIRAEAVSLARSILRETGGE